MMTAQHMADTIHRSVLSEISARRDVLAGIPLPPVHGFIRRPEVVADAWVQGIARQLKEARHHRAYDEATIRGHAENYATLCGRMASLEARQSFARHIGVEPPAGKRITPEGAAARLDDALWWRRQLRKVWTRASEDALREIGCIRRGKQPYASDAAVEHRAARARRTAEWLKSRAMVNEHGEQLELWELHQRSLANPALRRGEFMCRVRGFEEFAREAGHIALFWTLTVPSKYHAQHAGGEVNAAWDAADRPRVRDAQQWLRDSWARARAKLARLSVRVYGVRVAEPHHDGTPHWHMVLFSSPGSADTVRTVLRGIWLREDAAEPGAAEHRSKCIEIDPGKGSAAGYVAKYVSKNIDAAGAIGDEISDETDAPVSAGVQRVAAWAAVHGIRQFQQIGGAPVGLWRELRRLRDEVMPECIEDARAAADAGRWADFLRYAPEVQLVRETVRDGITTRPACSVNRYGELQRARVIGVRDWSGEVVTRHHRWRIERKTHGDHARSTVAVACKAAQRAPRGFSSRSAPRSGVPALGPVAITVREPGSQEMQAREVARAVAAMEDEAAGRDWRRFYAKGRDGPARAPTKEETERLAAHAVGISTPASNPERFGKHVKARRTSHNGD